MKLTLNGHPFWACVTVIDDPIKDQHVLTPQFQLLHSINKQSSMYVNVGKAFTMPSLSDTFRSVSRRYTAVSSKTSNQKKVGTMKLGTSGLTKG